MIVCNAGHQTRQQGETRVLQSLNNLVTKWPRETFSGFMVHFTNRNMEALSEFSTIDTSILVLGALQAANYFGGEAAALAAQLRAAVRWSDAIYAADNAGLAATVDPGSGAHGGWVAPFNEYYLVAYLANMTEAAGSKVELRTIHRFHNCFSQSRRRPLLWANRPLRTRARNGSRILRVLLVSVPTCNRSLIYHNRRV